MKNIKEFPRVLIIYHSCINKKDTHGVSLREWFADFPKENLSQIYSGGEVGEERFCAYNFKLGEKDRRLGKLFSKIKGSSLGQSSYVVTLDHKTPKLNKFSLGALLKNKISWWLINTGLWEIIFKPKMSNQLVQFVQNFRPDLIYCQGYSLTFAWLPVMIQEKFKLPICFQTGDDWPSYLYKNSPLSFAIRPVVDGAVRALMRKSQVRLANGKLMVKDYQKKYGLEFTPLMMCDNIDRFDRATPQRVADNTTISIVYSGNLGQGRWVSIVELCEAARLLEDHKILVTAFATTIPQEGVNALRSIVNLQVLPGPSHEQLPCYLKGADILFLPETFNEAKAEEIRLSISTKAHFYMMSKVPVLVYGSEKTGIVDYAKEEGWALVLAEHNLIKLTAALRELINDDKVRQRLVDKGVEVVLKNHMEDTVKNNFLSVLKSIQLT